MGQRRLLRAAVPGEVPQLLRSPGLPRGPPHRPDQDRRPGEHLGLAAGALGHHPGALARRVHGHHQPLRRRDRGHQRRVRAGLNRAEETQPETGLQIRGRSQKLKLLHLNLLGESAINCPLLPTVLYVAGLGSSSGGVQLLVVSAEFPDDQGDIFR